MQATATGTFQVKVTPLPPGDGPHGLGRFHLAKTFEGALTGTSAGEMLSAGNPASGSAGYVALEIVDGAIGERRGTFALQHGGTMDGGTQALSITVVPGSGSAGFAGISGHLVLEIAGGVHNFTLHYRLPD
jgi:hypothetical protein